MIEMQTVLNIKQDIVIVGAKDFGVMVANALRELGINVVGFCDNDRDIWGNKIFGKRILSFQKAVEKWQECLYVLCVFREKNRLQMEEQLRQLGVQNIMRGIYIFAWYQEQALAHGIPYRDAIELFDKIESEKGIMLNDVTISITQSCTLHCKNCSFLERYRKEHRHLEIEPIASDIRRLADNVDVIKSLNIFGGEVFTYMDGLIHLLEKIADIRNVLQIKLVTNGTIVPSDEQLSILKRYVSFVEISDYGKLSKKKDVLCAILEHARIPYRVMPESKEWFSIGEMKRYGRTEEYLKKQFAMCPWKECTPLHNGKLYRCCEAAYAEDLGVAAPEGRDWIDIRNEEGMNIKKRIEEMTKRTDILEFCDYCGVDFETLVPSAEQY